MALNKQTKEVYTQQGVALYYTVNKLTPQYEYFRYAGHVFLVCGSQEKMMMQRLSLI